MISRIGIVIVVFAAATGCGSTPKLMPTPTLYSQAKADPFADVPQNLQSNRVEVLFATDREAEEGSTPEERAYGFKRSRSVAFGKATLEIGKDISWEELVAESRTDKRSQPLELRVTNVLEMGKFPPTPKTLAVLPQAMEPATAPTDEVMALREELESAYDECQEALSARLAQTPDKEVFVYVHGYNNGFDSSVRTIGQIWHFLGRRGVPIAYSWPAGRGGLLRGYTYDSESGEFTVHHLKQMLRVIAANPDVKKMHIIAHSRGTAVAVSALRELHLETRAAGRSTREELKLGTLVLAAPDMDVEVVIQKLVTVHLFRVPERAALYVCSNDKALGLSNWLSAGSTRLGKLKSDIFSPEEIEALRRVSSIQVIDARVSNPGDFGHNYFYSNPAVSSDLVLLLRYALLPGAERPLETDAGGFWVIEDGYPGELPLPQDSSASTR